MMGFNDSSHWKEIQTLKSQQEIMKPELRRYLLKRVEICMNCQSGANGPKYVKRDEKGKHIWNKMTPKFPNLLKTVYVQKQNKPFGYKRDI